MVTVGEIISQLRLCDKNLTIEKLIEKPEVVTLLSRVFDSLSPKSKKAARKLFSRTKNASKKKIEKNFYLTTILEVKEIILPVEVREIFIACKAKPSGFWNPLGIQLDLEWSVRESRHCVVDSKLDAAIAQAYLGLKGLDIKRKWHTIVWRFYTLFFYELALLVGDGGVLLTTIVLSRLLKVITTSSAISDDCETIKENLNKWTAAGSRYYKLCSSLSAGALFLLPQLPDNTWEDKSLNGVAYNEAIEHLISCKICELSKSLGADDLATKIRAAALEPFRWNIEGSRLRDQPHDRYTSDSATEGIGPFPDVHEPSGIHHGGLNKGAPGSSPTEASTFTALEHFNNVSQIGHLRNGRAPIDLLYEAAVQAETNDQISGEQVSPGQTRTIDSSFPQLMSDQSPAGYQNSRPRWESIHFNMADSTWSDGIDVPDPNKITSFQNWNASANDWDNGIAVRPPNQVITLDDWNDGIDVPLPNQGIHLDNWNDGTGISLPDQIIPPQNDATLTMWNDAINIPPHPSTSYS